MEEQEREKVLQKAIDTWGERAQIDQMIEEMAELIVALNKYKRMKFFGGKKEGVLENVLEELGDVKNCFEQMEIVFGKDKVEESSNVKLKKLMKYLEI